MTTDAGAPLRDLVTTLRGHTVAVHDERNRGSGSGVLWTAGIVVTNAHVVSGRAPTIVLADGRRTRASLVARDPQRDLAIVRLPHEFRAHAGDAVLKRDSRTLVPGELVVAVGHPHGIAGAAAAGIVHRCNARWVMADVRLAPGNSGGPLADATGRVVGINSMIASGLALAVPSAAVAAFLRAIGEDARAA
jgi:serine protease Do